MDMYQKREQRRNRQVEESDTAININWYPGHMTKARREIKEKLALVDIIYEVIDSY